jgi:hypothetical protein
MRFMIDAIACWISCVTAGILHRLACTLRVTHSEELSAVIIARLESTSSVLI